MTTQQLMKTECSDKGTETQYLVIVIIQLPSSTRNAVLSNYVAIVSGVEYKLNLVKKYAHDISP